MSQDQLNHLRTFEQYKEDMEFDSIDEGFFSFAKKILGFLFGKSKKLRNLGAQYLRLKRDRAAAAIPIYAKISRALARESNNSPTIQEFRKELNQRLESIDAEIRGVDTQLEELALDNDSYKKDVERIRKEGDALEKNEIAKARVSTQTIAVANNEA
jgi:septal ring factor EnvC (AmiA/AmiB activator)